MNTDGTDDQKPPRASSLPPALSSDATRKEMVDVLNALLVSSRTHSVELEGIRLAMQAHGTNIETFCQRLEWIVREALKGRIP